MGILIIDMSELIVELAGGRTFYDIELTSIYWCLCEVQAISTASAIFFELCTMSGLGIPVLLLLIFDLGSGQFDNYLINCGNKENTTDSDGRIWMGEGISSYAKNGTMCMANKVLKNSPVTEEVLYSARFFKSTSTYEFPVSKGRHWVRLHFYPFDFSSYNTNKAVFSVSANDYILFYNLSIVSELGDVNKAYLFKEYNLNVVSSTLRIKFYPSNIFGSYAFINAMEVISVPDNYVDDATLVNAGKKARFGMSYIALETMYRLNVGGKYIGPTSDSGLTRTWQPDDIYLEAAKRGATYNGSSSADINYLSTMPNYTAPPEVFRTARSMSDAPASQAVNGLDNLSWVFHVDSNYTYYVRLLFCELQYASASARRFDIYLNSMVAYLQLDVYLVVGSVNTGLYKDFAVEIPAGSSQLRLGLSPVRATYNNCILNGLEILKMNNSIGSLAGISWPAGFVPSSLENPSSTKNNRSTRIIVGVVVGTIVAMAIVASFLCLLFRPKEKVAWPPQSMRGTNASASIWSIFSLTARKRTGSIISSGTSSHEGRGRYFSLREILDATRNFDEALVLGVGGFGKVYKGELSDGTIIAAKRASPSSQQGLAEFHTEINMLSKLRHRHLVSLIGYCEEKDERVLVYEYMANGTLKSHLYGSDLPPLSWNQRLDICIAAARGLHYLHTGSAQGIIHRDVKTTNILLDHTFVAKVSDFGLSKVSSLDQSHISTAVKGSFGYLDPEYYKRQQLTEKSDVYSFGVVLFEVMCARPAIDPSLPSDQVNIAEWAIKYQNLELLNEIVDPRLEGQCNRQSLLKFAETAEKCLAEEGIDRPSINDVLWNLEYALQMQDMSIENKENNNRVEEIPLASRSSGADYSGIAGNAGGANVVFSQLVNSQGRL